MAIKNFLFLVVAFSLVTCTTPDRRSGRNQTPVAISQPQPVAIEQPKQSGEIYSVGIYLGPGAMRTYAHIGVLRVLQRMRIPIAAIGGFEWGSVMAAIYSGTGKANDVEWELMKLKKDQLPTSSLLRRSLKARDSQDIRPFLKTIFNERDLEKGSLPFSCPTTDGDNTFFVNSGKARDQLSRCMVLPPLYTLEPASGKFWMSGIANPGDWVTELRKSGAQFIVYVDVISQGSYLEPSRYADPAELTSLWAAIKTISRQQHGYANFVIEVPTSIELSAFEKRREAIAAGEKAATEALSPLMKSIGMQAP